MKKYIKPHARMLIMAFVFSLLASGAAILVQFVKGRLLDTAISQKQALSLRLSLFLLLIILFEILCYYLFYRCRGRFFVNARQQLRQDFFASRLFGPLSMGQKDKEGETLAQYTDQINLVSGQMLQNLPSLMEVIFKILLVSVALILLDVRIALVTLFLSTTPLYVPKLIQGRLEKAQKASTAAFQAHLGRVNEWLSALELLRNFGARKAILRRFTASNEEVSALDMGMRKLGYLSQTISSCLSYLSHFIILAFAALLVARGEFTPGQFVIAVGMIDQVSYPILYISVYLQEMIAARPIARQLLKTMEAQKEPALKASVEQVQNLRFSGLSYAYEANKPLFHPLNLNLAPGDKCLITGPSGAGKSTLVSLLLAHDRPTSGAIHINGTPVTDLKNLNQLVTVMRQQPLFFEDSLKNNLTLYQDIKEERILDLLRQLNLSDFASPEGLLYPISENGQNLSGGEKRRLSLARTLLRGSPIVVLDEPLAEVDPDTVAQIERVIAQMQGTTLIVISHQVSPALRAAFSHHVHLTKQEEAQES